MSGEIVRGMSREQYDKLQRINWSSLKHMGKSPAHYRHNLLSGSKDTAAKQLGRACHVACLEPERFRAEYAVWEGGRRASKEWEAFKAKHPTGEIIKDDEYQECMAIQQAVRADATAAKYLAGGASEVSILWRHEVPAIGGLSGYAMDCKSRLDFVSAAGALVDLKTTRNASPDGFGRESWSYHYQTQAAFYSDAYHAATGQRLPYVLVAVETSAPYAVAVYRVPDIALDAGREEYRALLERLHYCRSNNVWPGYTEGESELCLPKWAGLGSEDEDAAGLGLTFHEQGATP